MFFGSWAKRIGVQGFEDPPRLKEAGAQSRRVNGKELLLVRDVHPLWSASMPSSVTPRRRQRDETQDDEGRSVCSEAPASSQSSKRAKLNGNGHVSPEQTPLLPNDYQSRPLGNTHATVSYDETSSMKYQPGSIVRVKLINFVTYTKVEFLPGPSLNMVIGPNGTGKSTLVCAICLGLGWGPQVRFTML